MGAAGSLKEAIAAIVVRENLPDGAELTALARETAAVLESLPAQSRPRSRNGQAGGLFELPADRPSLVIPDLHARTGFLVDLLGGAWCGERATLDALGEGSLSLLFLGDGFHSERNGIERWLSAWVDYRAGFPRGNAMRSEMRDSLAVMEIVMRLILAFPRSVAFLKGNHENVRNEEGEGNHPFRKYADEGQMVLDFFLAEYGEGVLGDWARFEGSLPLMARGGRFIASHAEPRRAYSPEEIIGARGDHDIVTGLTWTRDGESAEGSVSGMLESFLPGVEDAFYFGGHRIVGGGYALRAGGRFVQLHDPVNRSVARVAADAAFNPERDVRSVK